MSAILAEYHFEWGKYNVILSSIGLVQQDKAINAGFGSGERSSLAPS
jgi:hypothetical protein